jgi:hypothetical protein
MKNRIKVINVDYGLASFYENFIEINRKLENPLRAKILAHELRHTEGRYSLKDFKNDFAAKNSHFREAFLFCLKNPEALIGYFLIMLSYHLKKFTYNLSAVVPLVYFGVIWLFFWKLLFGIGLFKAFMGYLVVYSAINLILLIYTHFYVLKQGKKGTKTQDQP